MEMKWKKAEHEEGYAASPRHCDIMGHIGVANHFGHSHDDTVLDKGPERDSPMFSVFGKLGGKRVGLFPDQTTYGGYRSPLPARQVPAETFTERVAPQAVKSMNSVAGSLQIPFPRPLSFFLTKLFLPQVVIAGADHSIS